MPNIIDLRLLELSIDLNTLESHFQLIEEEITRGEEAAEQEFRDKWQATKFKDGAEWDVLRQDRDFQVNFVLPRVFRGSFLITMFTVYETAVTEIASLIQERKGIQISLDGGRGSLLNRARKYYKDVLEFPLSKNDRHWQRISLLSDVRNAIAHTNGRIDMLKAKVKRNVLGVDGVSERFGYIVFGSDFLQETFSLVREELESLVARYKQWDSDWWASQQARE